jgi:hypothetical protein
MGYAVFNEKGRKYYTILASIYYFSSVSRGASSGG